MSTRVAPVKDPIAVALEALAQLALVSGTQARITHTHDRWFVSVDRHLGISEVGGELVDAAERCLAMAQLSAAHRFFNVVHTINGRPLITTRVVTEAP